MGIHHRRIATGLALAKCRLQAHVLRLLPGWLLQTSITVMTGMEWMPNQLRSFLSARWVDKEEGDGRSVLGGACGSTGVRVRAGWRWSSSNKESPRRRQPRISLFPRTHMSLALPAFGASGVCSLYRLSMCWVLGGDCHWTEVLFFGPFRLSLPNSARPAPRPSEVPY